MSTNNNLAYESHLARCGVPRHCWHVKIDNFKPKSIPFDNNQILEAKKQKIWIDELLKTNPKTNPRTVISSGPSDKIALAIASRMVANRILSNYRSNPLMINSADINIKELPSCDFCVIYNIFSQTQDYRLQAIRDLVTKLDYCPVVLVLGGLKPIEFARNLNLNINRAAYYSEVTSV